MVIGIKEKASVHEEARSTAPSRAGQRFKQRWDCSQVENQEEGMQWAEDEKLEKNLEQRRIKGSSLKVKVMQKVPELVAHERYQRKEERKMMVYQ